MTKKAITTENAPGAIGPYSQAVVANGLVFCSGQIPLDPATGELVNGSAADQTHRVMKNLGEVLKAAELDYNNVLKATIYVTDLSEFAAINDVYVSYFSKPLPARATVQVAALPMGAMVEIDLIASAKEG